MTTVPSPRRVTAGHAAAGHRCGIIMICGLLGACAQVPTEPAARAAYEEANDPAEPTNRVIFAGNQWVDRNAIRPVAQVYTDYVPGRVRSSLRNFSRNLQEPSTLVNDALQGNLSRAWVTAQRFALNSTVGGLGLFDVATDWDLPGHQADYGQTFGVWGAGPGPSVQLPLFGSSNLRDTAGRAVGMVANPLGFVSGETFQTVRAVGGAVGMVGQRADALPVTTTWNAAPSTTTPPCEACLRNVGQRSSKKAGPAVDRSAARRMRQPSTFAPVLLRKRAVRDPGMHVRSAGRPRHGTAGARGWDQPLLDPPPGGADHVPCPLQGVRLGLRGISPGFPR